MLSTLQPPAPELLNPENYYTVVYDYVSRSRIKNSLSGDLKVKKNRLIPGAIPL